MSKRCDIRRDIALIPGLSSFSNDIFNTELSHAMLSSNAAKNWMNDLPNTDCFSSLLHLVCYHLQKPDIQSPGDGAGPSSWESETENFQHEGLDRAAEGNARGDPSTTPELFPEPNECNQDTKKFFPLFRPKSQWKVRSRRPTSEYCFCKRRIICLTEHR